jgi:HEPN domain
VPFRKTHDLLALGLQCSDLDPGLTPLLNEAADLTDYASMFRYPDAPYEPDMEEALHSLELAERPISGSCTLARISAQSLQTKVEKNAASFRLWLLLATRRETSKRATWNE